MDTQVEFPKKTMKELGFEKFKFRVLLDDNIICKRNYYSNKSLKEVRSHYDDVVEIIENFINVEEPNFHHHVVIKFSYLGVDITYNVTLYCEKYKINIKPILENVVKKLDLRNPRTK